MVTNSSRILKSYRVGRRVWVRDLSQWVPCTVVSVFSQCVTVETDDAFKIHIHFGVVHRDLRVNRPSDDWR